MTDTLSLVFFGILAGLVSNFIFNVFITHDISRDYDLMTLTILQRAVSLLPQEQRERYLEEWLSFICEQETPFKGFIQSLGCLKAAVAIHAQEQILEPVGMKIKHRLSMVASRMIILAEIKKASKYYEKQFVSFVIYLSLRSRLVNLLFLFVITTIWLIKFVPVIRDGLI